MRESQPGLENALAKMPRFREILEQMPVVSSVLFFQYALMLHYCITGEKISRSELEFQTDYQEEEPSEKNTADRHQTWMAEQMLLKVGYSPYYLSRKFKNETGAR